MAKNKRTCEACGGFSSPHIPRQRVNGRLLCQGCAARELAKTSSKDDQPQPEQQQFDFWEGDLAPREDVHPLQQPLPNSVWEKFAQHRKLLGKPKVFLSEHLEEAEKRAGDSDPIPGSRNHERQRQSGGKTAAAEHMAPGPELAKHLQDAHGMAPAVAHIYGGSTAHHEKLHADEVQDHHHDDKGAPVSNEALVGGKSAELPHPTGPEEIKQHLKDHHHLADWEIEMQGGDEDALHDMHEHEHSSTATSPDHTHAEGVASKETAGGSVQEGPEQLKHPSKYTNSSLYAHLLTDHGVHPELADNAIKGTFEGTDNSHVVHMLHNAAHKNGQMVNDHEHEGWSGPPWVHPGHKDVGKPFWGAPPNTVGKTLEHLSESPENGGHGIPHEELPDVSTLSDEDAKDVLAEHHGNLHDVDDAGELSHQHVPTAVKGVKTPKQIAKGKLIEHLQKEHGVTSVTFSNPEMSHSELHDPEAFAYNGHPGHEHAPDNPHGPVTQALPDKPLHFEHGSNMSHQDLLNHLQLDHKGWKGGQKPSGGDFTAAFLDFSDHSLSHEEVIQKHALMHASGESSPHTHEPVGIQSPLEDANAHYGHEPEIQTDTHPHVGTDAEALDHIIKHHPNVTVDDLNDWKKGGESGSKPSMVKYHEALHTPGAKTAMGNTLPKVLDGHDHEDAVGVPTTIAVGHHLVTEHGMDKAEVASMTPEQFKAHHEQLHLKDSEFDVGHGHDYPGGPMRDPRVILPNTHHQKFRDNDKHPAVQEWYHGTGADYEGAPKNATELKNDHDMWGNFGAGDWNNHVGSHWTSLHSMARNFQGGGKRVIHAKLHIANPVTYNSLNHMSHDAYDRLHESGHLQDDGRYYKNHYDDPGYDAGVNDNDSQCCSGRLLEYAKGHHRSDGKFGVEAFRDSLRASGYDGIHVRNQADYPQGHWNAIPLSADQIEITHGGCKGEHGDERDSDREEFSNNEKISKGDWQHPKPFDHKAYIGRKLDHLPDEDEVQQANAAKGQRPTTNKTAEGRGDSDKYLSFDPDTETGDEDENHYCEHCDDMTDHTSENCTVSKWCHVCDESGDHTAAEGHEYCDHCEDHTDHDTDGCTENPDNWGKESYCPHCDTKDKENEHKSECVNCGQKLPDWGDLQTHGKAVKPEDYDSNGETAKASYGLKSEAKLSGGTTDQELANHLYHHHKSDVGGPEFDNNGSWDIDALKHHHQWLHQNPEHATEEGFTVDHKHKNVFGEFKKKMTPEETHAHLLMSHSGSGAGKFGVPHIIQMTPEQAVEAHEKSHMTDDAVKWGSKDSDGDLIKKHTHTHNLDADPEVPGLDDAPTGHKLLKHLGDKQFHLPSAIVQSLKPMFNAHPGVAEALHKQMHANHGPATEGGPNFHVHGEEFDKQQKLHQAVLKHLTHDHGVEPSLIKDKGDLNGLMEAHKWEHNGAFPQGNGGEEHVHFGGVAHSDPEGHTAATAKPKEPEKPAEPEPAKQQEQFPELKSSTVHGLATDHGGYGMEDHLHYHHPEVHKGLQQAEGFDYAPGTPKFQGALKEAYEAHMKAHAEGADHDHGGTAKAAPKASDKPKIKLDSPAKNKYAPGSVMHHIQYEHAGSPLDDMAGDVLDTATDHGDHSAKTNSHYLEMAKAHQAYHKEHGHPGHTHYDDEPHPKEASRRTLTALFEEVAI